MNGRSALVFPKVPTLTNELAIAKPTVPRDLATAVDPARPPEGAKSSRHPLVETTPMRALESRNVPAVVPSRSDPSRTIVVIPEGNGAAAPESKNGHRFAAAEQGCEKLPSPRSRERQQPPPREITAPAPPGLPYFQRKNSQRGSLSRGSSPRANRKKRQRNRGAETQLARSRCRGSRSRGRPQARAARRGAGGVHQTGAPSEAAPRCPPRCVVAGRLSLRRPAPNRDRCQQSRAGLLRSAWSPPGVVLRRLASTV